MLLLCKRCNADRDLFSIRLSLSDCMCRWAKSLRTQSKFRFQNIEKKNEKKSIVRGSLKELFRAAELMH